MFPQNKIFPQRDLRLTVSHAEVSLSFWLKTLGLKNGVSTKNRVFAQFTPNYLGDNEIYVRDNSNYVRHNKNYLRDNEIYLPANDT